MRAALEQLLDAVGEARARRILTVVGTRTAQAEFERTVASRMTLRLLRERTPRATIRERLIQNGMPRATAYRLISVVMNSNCPKDACSLGRSPGTVPATEKTTMDQQCREQEARSEK